MSQGMSHETLEVNAYSAFYSITFGFAGTSLHDLSFTIRRNEINKKLEK